MTYKHNCTGCGKCKLEVELPQRVRKILGDNTAIAEPFFINDPTDMGALKDAFVQRVGGEGPMIDAVAYANAVMRLSLNVKRGALEVMMTHYQEMSNRMVEIWGSHESSVRALMAAEKAGICFATYEETIEMFRMVVSVLEKTHSFEPAEDETEEQQLVELWEVIAWRFGKCFGADKYLEREELPPSMQVPTFAPAFCISMLMQLGANSALDVMLRRAGEVNEAERDQVCVEDFWAVVAALSSRSVTLEEFKKLIEISGVWKFVALGPLAQSRVVNAHVFRQLINNPQIIQDRSANEIVSLLNDWHQVRRRVRLNEFAQRWGSLDAYTAW